jgi:hypothetical protein
MTIRGYLSTPLVSDALCHNGGRTRSEHMAGRRRWRDRGPVREALVVGHNLLGSLVGSWRETCRWGERSGTGRRLGWGGDSSSGRLRGEVLPTPVVLLDQIHPPGRPVPVSPRSPHSQILQRIRGAKISCQESTNRRGGSQGSRARPRYWRRRTIVRVAAPAA